MSPTTKTPKPIQEVAAEPAYLVKEIAAHLRTEQSVIYNLIRDEQGRRPRRSPHPDSSPRCAVPRGPVRERGRDWAQIRRISVTRSWTRPAPPR